VYINAPKAKLTFKIWPFLGDLAHDWEGTSKRVGEWSVRCFEAFRWRAANLGLRGYQKRLDVSTSKRFCVLFKLLVVGAWLLAGSSCAKPDTVRHKNVTDRVGAGEGGEG
jgi:hypothetical protein